MTPEMKAVALTRHLPIDDPDALQDRLLPRPQPGPRDLLVRIEAVSVNPVDTKLRGAKPATPAQIDPPRILGFDAAGVVEAVGADVALFQPGDEVYYAGDITRPGCNAQYHLVDERLAGPKPTTLDFAQAAALPLTTITAWELLFERLGVREGKGDERQSLLVIGAAGGVGSILVQLARQLTGLTVIGTASRAETQQWVRELGAHHMIDHSQPLLPQLKALGHDQVSMVASLTHTDQHLDPLIEALQPQGKLALIDDPAQLDVVKLKRKSLSLHWEFMYTRSLFQTEDMVEQHRLLNRVSQLIDDGVLKTTVGEHFGRIDAANLRRAHALLESGKARGKIVLEGF